MLVLAFMPGTLFGDDRADGLYTSGDFIFPVFQSTDRPLEIRGRVVEWYKVLVKIGGQPLKTSQQPTRECVANLPENLSGLAPVEITAGQQFGFGLVRFLRISRTVTGDLHRLQLLVKVDGLDGIDRPLRITITNNWGASPCFQDPGPDSYIPRGWFTYLSCTGAHLTIPSGRKVASDKLSDIRSFDLTPKELVAGLAQKSFLLTCPITGHKLKQMEDVGQILSRKSGASSLSVDVVPTFDRTLSRQFAPGIVSEWEKESGYQLSAETKRYVVSEFDRERGRPSFIELAQGYQGTIHSVSDFERGIIRFYLFRVVEPLANQAAFRASRLPLSLAFYGTDSHTMTYQVSKFLADLRNNYKFVRGWMELDSEHKTMSVQDLDSDRFVGATEQAFLFSIGEHHVKLTNGVSSPCAFTLNILPGPNGSRKCIPSSASMPVGLP